MKLESLQKNMLENKIKILQNEIFIFDLDGTIVDSKQLMSEALKKCYQLIGQDDPPYERFFSLMGESLEKIFESLDLPLDLTTYYKEYCSRNKHIISIFPEMSRILTYLVLQKKKIAILTGKDRERTIEILKMYNLLHYFDFIVTSDDVTHSKPHPEGVEMILQRFNAKKSMTILVGDGLFDIQCAKNANINSAFVCWGTGNKEAVRVLAPEFIYNSAQQLASEIYMEG
jgi:HAD superfamily hydrolase (TIGR01509 family)